MSTLDRRTPFILGVLVLALVVAVLALSFKVMSSSDGREDERVASVTTTDPVEESESSAQTAPATSAPPVSPSIPATTVLPPAEPSTTESSSSAPPSTTAPLVAYSDELVSALDGYITALDQGDIELAYSYVAVSLRVQDGWDHGTFSTFWTESVVGAEVVSVDDVSTSTGAITLTVDYALPEGATSRESVVATFAPAGDAGFLVMVDYEVLDTERIG